MDPIADIALLGSVDNQEQPEQAEAFEALTKSGTPLPLTALQFARRELRLSNGETAFGHLVATADAWLLGLDDNWFSCRLSVRRAIWVEAAAQPIASGMSGSPIITRGGAVGICCLSPRIREEEDAREGGPNPFLPFALPGWMVNCPAR